MRQFLTGLRCALAVIGVLAVVLTLVSVVPLPIWWIQATGFPRLQTLAVLTLVLLGLLLLRWPAQRRVWAVLLASSALALGAQASFFVALPAFCP